MSQAINLNAGTLLSGSRHHIARLHRQTLAYETPLRRFENCSGHSEGQQLKAELGNTACKIEIFVDVDGNDIQLIYRFGIFYVGTDVVLETMRRVLVDQQ